MPNFIKPSGRYDWAKIVTELQRHPDQWILMIHDAPLKLVRDIGGPTAVFAPLKKALVRPNGRVQALGGNVYVSTEGHKRVEVYLRWHPTGG